MLWGGRPLRCSVLFLFVFFSTLAAGGDESPVNITGAETNYLRLYYYNYLKYLEPLAVRTFTNSMEWQRRMFDWTPSERITVLLQDSRDIGTAYAFPAPHSTLLFDVGPQTKTFETSPASERLYSTMNHELVHVVQTDNASAQDRRWRNFFFGKVGADRRNPETLLYTYLTIPRFTAPRWYSEGGAVFFETWMDGGLGRAQGGYDEMVFRAMVRDKSHFYDPLGLVSRGTKVDFQTGANAYLYGGRFVTWLAYAYSPEKVVAWIRRDEGSARYYADQFQQVFGIPLEQAWQDWIRFEHEFQEQNLAEVRKFPLTPVVKLSAAAAGSVSRLYFDESKSTLFGAFRSPGIAGTVAALNVRDGALKRLADIKGAISYRVCSLAYDPGSGTVFYTEDNNALRDLMAVDVKTGVVRTLLKDQGIGEFVFNPTDRSLIGVRHWYGLATLVRIPYPYDDWKKIHTFPWEHVPSDLDISPDGKLLSASMSDEKGDQYVRVWDLQKLLAGDLKPLSEFGFGQSVPEGFVFSPDGRHLYGSSYYTGVSNIYRYEVATGKVEAMSNAETGFFRPVPLADGRLIVLTYTGEGFVPGIIEPKPLKDLSAIKFLGAEVAEKHPVVKTWKVAAPGTVDDRKLVTRTEPYVPLHSLELANAYPMLQGYKNAVGVGYRVNYEDPLDYTSLSITAAYTPTGTLPSNERAHFSADYRYRFWRSSVSWNRSDFYDLFGPTIRSRKGFAATLNHTNPLIWDLPRRLDVKSDFAFYDRMDTLPQAQNVSATSPRLTTGGVGLRYTDVRRSVGAVDDEYGISWGADLKGNLAAGPLIPILRGTFDFGVPLPLLHSSIWLRNAAGVASGARNDPYANFYFGGFGNNYVDSLSEKRYREPYSFPGFDIDELSGRSYTRHQIEWNLPPYVFESVGTPAFYLTWLRPALFASALWTDPADASRRKRYANLGAQVDLSFSVLHRYDMTLSLGYAAGYRGSDRAGSEWMVSLKIM